MFLEPFPSPRCNNTVTGCCALNEVIHMFPWTQQLLMLYSANDLVYLRTLKRLLIAFWNFVFALKRLLSWKCTKPFATRFALKRLVQTFPHKHSSCSWYFSNQFIILFISYNSGLCNAAGSIHELSGCVPQILFLLLGAQVHLLEGLLWLEKCISLHKHSSCSYHAVFYMWLQHLLYFRKLQGQLGTEWLIFQILFLYL